MLLSACVVVCTVATWRFIHMARALRTKEQALLVLTMENKELRYQLTATEKAHQAIEEKFRHLSNEALLRNNESFMQLAKGAFEQLLESSKTDLLQRQQHMSTVLEPIQKALGGVDEKLALLEKERLTAYVDLRRQVHDLLTSQTQLRTETANLVKALRTPHARGQWGEMQLKRVVEMAGMLSHCDFIEQQSVDGGKLRPDLVINLPGGKTIVVDAKTPLAAYLNALEEEQDLEKIALLEKHAQHVRGHIKALSQRAYWEQFKESPDFVVMFLPGEAFFSAALERDPSLIEYGVKEKVILATPTTLIALLRAVAYGWRQESLADNAKAVAQLGRNLYKRLSDMASHFSRMGKHVNGMVDSYNAAMGTFEKRVLVSARHFTELDNQLADIKMESLTPVESIARRLHTYGDDAPITQETLPHESNDNV
jgi:DNA recombination protein RmuC